MTGRQKKPTKLFSCKGGGKSQRSS